MPFILTITAISLDKEHLRFVDKRTTHLHHSCQVEEGHKDAVSSMDHVLFTVCQDATNKAIIVGVVAVCHR